jgi:hypothetical protein
VDSVGEENGRALEVPAIADDRLVALAEAAEARVEAINRIKRAALRVTNAHDWVDENGRPYLQVSGAEKVGRLFGVSWRIDEPIFEREEDGHFSYTYRGVFSLGAAEIEVIGARSSRDPFFSRSRGQDIPPSAIDKTDVKKAAYTNCIGNGITRILGIRNLTWDDLRDAGISPDGASRVDRQQAEMSPEAKGQREQLWSMLLEMAEGDEGKARVLLEAATRFTGRDGKEVAGKRDLSQVSERAIGPTYRKVKDTYDAWRKERQAAQSTHPQAEGGAAGGRAEQTALV